MIPTALVAVCVGLAAGFVLGRRNLPARSAGTGERAGFNGAVPVREVASNRPKLPTPVEIILRPEQLRAALLEIRKEPNEEIRRDRLRLLAGRITPPDALASLMVASEALSYELFQIFRDRLLELWAPRAPQAAMSYAMSVPPRSGREQCIRSVLQGWARHDASGVFQWFSSLAPGSERRLGARLVGEALGLYAPEEGIKVIKSVPAGWDRRDYVNAFFDAWSRVDAPAAAAKAGAELNSPDQRGLLGLLLTRWVEVDPEAAIAVLKTKPATGAGRELWSGVIERLSQDNPQRAADLVANVAGTTTRQLLLGIVARNWASRDLTAARAWAESLPKGPIRDTVIDQMASSIVEMEPGKAAEMLENHAGNGGGDRETWMYRAVAAAMASSDPKAALDWAAKIPSSVARRDATVGVLESWAAEDPKAAAAQAQSMPSGQLRDLALQNVVNVWANQDLAAVTEFVRQLDPGRNQQLLGHQLAWRLAAENPEGGLQFLDSFPAGPARNQFAANFGVSWAQNDLDSAVAWMKSLDDGALKRQVATQMRDAWVDQDPESAASFAFTLSDPQAQKEFISGLVGHWANQDLAAANAWVQSLPAGPNQDSAMQVLAENLGHTQPALAAEMALKLPQDLQSGALMTIVSNWSSADPLAAAEWVGRFPTGELKDRAEQQLVEQWSTQDPYSAADWLTRQPVGRARDAASSSLARQLREIDPSAAAVWIDAIQDPDLRLNAQWEQYSWWKSQDPDAARAWLSKSTVPAESRAEWESGAATSPTAPEPIDRGQ